MQAALLQTESVMGAAAERLELFDEAGMLLKEAGLRDYLTDFAVALKTGKMDVTCILSRLFSDTGRNLLQPITNTYQYPHTRTWQAYAAAQPSAGKCFDALRGDQSDAATRGIPLMSDTTQRRVWKEGGYGGLGFLPASCTEYHEWLLGRAAPLDPCADPDAYVTAVREMVVNVSLHFDETDLSPLLETPQAPEYELIGDADHSTIGGHDPKPIQKELKALATGLDEAIRDGRVEHGRAIEHALFKVASAVPQLRGLAEEAAKQVTTLLAKYQQKNRKMGGRRRGAGKTAATHDHTCKSTHNHA